ncbi:type II toxin-antitoxin system RelE/ParE family toxin [Sphingomonas sp. H39-1-10]|uniref:type II toxin-antitoxin system RelE/ParE family toxin n=1 Tax=Sphingomonas TaxID=13687 RepID=UPI00087FE92C|nr:MULTISPECIES: type II toxin-antitoxin system RelE/ParE family toxin [Sphingomonas]MDF0489160.1 type II toxin-antitoxin system RelE/ParE family toxin [Sphingomonas pollutisoli]SDA21136.1 toxin ParE1/3/4 [Sphingomonas sp. NFR15]
MAEFRLTPKAQRDIDDIFEYTVKQWSLAQALHYTDLLEAACASLANAPERSQDCAAIRPGFRRRVVAQHVIYFKQTRYGIAIIRVLHQRMDQSRHL